MDKIEKKRGGLNMKNMKKLIVLIAVSCFVGFTGNGCSSLMSMLGGPESPRPKEYQVSATSSMVGDSVGVVVGAQTNKQDNIRALAAMAVMGIGSSTTDEQAAAISSISANAFSAIQNADGTAGIIGKIMSKSVDDISRMPMGEYALYAAAQGVVASRNQEAAYEGIKLGWKWTSGRIAEAAGAATGGTGLLAFALSMFKKAGNRKKLLVKSGSAIKEFAAEAPDAGKVLKKKLASAHSEVPVNASKEFGLS